MKEKGKWTKGEWIPEKSPPTYNIQADAFQRAILTISDSNEKTIPAFAFGDDAEQCYANSWMIAAAKDLCKAVQLFLKDAPEAKEFAEQAMYKAMGHLENNTQL